MSETKPGIYFRLDRTIARIRYRGPSEVMRQLKGAISGWISSVDELVMFTAPPEPADASSDVVFRLATRTDALSYAQQIGTDSASTFGSRLTARTDCMLGMIGDRIVHASWITTGTAWTQELQRLVVVPPGGLYIYESFTSPEVRGRGIYPRALAAIRSVARDRGLVSTWVAVQAVNASSLRAVSKAGFEESFRVGIARRWGRVSLDLSNVPESAQVPQIRDEPH